MKSIPAEKGASPSVGIRASADLAHERTVE